MKNSLILASIFASTVGLQACKGAPKLTECPAASAAMWASSTHDVGSIINGYGAVHDTYITLERRGEFGVGSRVCEMTRIYCPKPHADKGCQTYSCDYVEATGALVQVKDFQGTTLYSTPKSAQVVWDGKTLYCGPALRAH